MPPNIAFDALAHPALLSASVGMAFRISSRIVVFPIGFLLEYVRCPLGFSGSLCSLDALGRVGDEESERGYLGDCVSDRADPDRASSRIKSGA